MFNFLVITLNISIGFLSSWIYIILLSKYYSVPIMGLCGDIDKLQILGVGHNVTPTFQASTGIISCRNLIIRMWQ